MIDNLNLTKVIKQLIGCLIYWSTNEWIDQIINPSIDRSIDQSQALIMDLWIGITLEYPTHYPKPKSNSYPQF